jgi:hypothetical protein
MLSAADKGVLHMEYTYFPNGSVFAYLAGFGVQCLYKYTVVRLLHYKHETVGYTARKKSSTYFVK